MTRKWCVMDLVVDHQTGKLRETAVWSNVGKAVMTWAFIHVTAAGALTEWFVAAYGGVVVLHETGARFLNQRQQQLDKEAKHDA